MSTSPGDIEQAAGRDDLNPQELRNLASKLAAQDTDEELLAAASGTLSGRTLASYFAYLDDRLRATRRENAKARADTHYLALLQAQLDALDGEIAALDEDIWNRLAEHLSAEELEYLRGIEDKDEQAREQLRLMRERLERGDMTQAEFDAFKERWDERAAKREQRADTAQTLRNAERSSPDTLAKTAEGEIERTSKTNVEAAGELVGGKADQVVLKTVDQYDDAGNETRTDSRSDALSIADMSSDSLFGDLPETNSSISSAQSIAPDTPVRDAAPNLKGHYQAAAANTEPAEPEATADIQLHHANAPGTGLG
jgi:hypothetical protein